MTTRKDNHNEHDLRVTIVFLVITIMGLYLMYVSTGLDSMENRPILDSVGSTLLTVGFLSFAYELFLRRSFLNTVKSAIRSEMPQRYANIKSAGIVDAYDYLDIESIRRKIRSSEASTIRVMKIWFPYFRAYEDDLIKAINERRCRLEVLLVDPKASQGIEARASVTSMEMDDIKSEIEKNLYSLARIRDQVDPLKKDRISVKLHNSFISVSLFWFGEVVIMGLYLHDKISTEGIQIKISGSNHPFYKSIRDHFEKEWRNARDVTDKEWGKYSG